MAEHNYRKRSKLCVITVKEVNKEKAGLSDFDDIKNETIFKGTKIRFYKS